MSNGSTDVNMLSGVQSLKKHKISLLVLMCLMYSFTCGGPFGIENIVSAVGPGLAILVLLIFPFLFSVPQGLIAAELGSAIPDEGGYYVWTRRAFGEFWGYQVGWWRSISCYFDSALYIILAVGYLNAFVALTPVQAYIAKVALILFFMVINLRGLGDVGKLTTALTLFVVATAILFVILGFINWNQNPFEPFAVEGQGVLGGIGLSIAIAIWLYSGYESIGTVAGEIENPQLIPKAILLSLPIVVATYVLPIIAGMAAYGDWSAWSADRGVNFVSISASFGIPGLVILMGLGAMVCNLSLYNSYLASGSRGFFVLADDNLAPKWLCKVDKKHGAPYIAIVSMALVNLLLVQFDFATILVINVFLFVLSYLVWFLSGIALRYKEPDLHRPFKIPGGNGFLIFILIAPVIICLVTFFINGISYMIAGSLGVLTGPITYVIFKKKYGGLNNSKAILSKDKVAAVLLSIAMISVTGLGFFLYAQERENVDYDLAALHNDYLSAGFEMDEITYDLVEDSFVTYFYFNDDPEIAVEVWYYYGDMTGYVWLPYEYQSESEFAATVFAVLDALAESYGGLPLSYIEFEDEAGWYFYSEYGEVYGSVNEVLDAME